MKEEIIDGIKYRLDEDNLTAEVMGFMCIGHEYHYPERICSRCHEGYSGQEECPKCGKKNDRTMILY